MTTPREPRDDLDQFGIGVDSCEDIYVICHACRRDVRLGRFDTLGELVAQVVQHVCEPREASQ